MSGRLQQVSEGQASPEVPINENFDALEHMACYAKDPEDSTGLTLAYYGGRWGGFEIADGTLTLVGEGSPTPTNYIVVDRTTGAISVSQTVTNWNNVGKYARVYKITTNASAVVTIEDHRSGTYGVHGGGEGINFNDQTDDYTLALTDAGHCVRMNKSTAVNLTIPLNSSVAYPVGKSTVIRQKGAGQVTIVATGGVTLNYRAEGSPPSASALAGQHAIAVLMKEGTDEWTLTGDLA